MRARVTNSSAQPPFRSDVIKSWDFRDMALRRDGNSLDDNYEVEGRGEARVNKCHL